MIVFKKFLIFNVNKLGFFFKKVVFNYNGNFFFKKYVVLCVLFLCLIIYEFIL